LPGQTTARHRAVHRLRWWFGLLWSKDAPGCRRTPANAFSTSADPGWPRWPPAGRRCRPRTYRIRPEVHY